MNILFLVVSCLLLSLSKCDICRKFGDDPCGRLDRKWLQKAISGEIRYTSISHPVNIGFQKKWLHRLALDDISYTEIYFHAGNGGSLRLWFEQKSDQFLSARIVVKDNDGTRTSRYCLGDGILRNASMSYRDWVVGEIVDLCDGQSDDPEIVNDCKQIRQDALSWKPPKYIRLPTDTVMNLTRIESVGDSLVNAIYGATLWDAYPEEDKVLEVMFRKTSSETEMPKVVAAKVEYKNKAFSANAKGEIDDSLANYFNYETTTPTTTTTTTISDEDMNQKVFDLCDEILDGKCFHVNQEVLDTALGNVHYIRIMDGRVLKIGSKKIWYGDFYYTFHAGEGDWNTYLMLLYKPTETSVYLKYYRFKIDGKEEDLPLGTLASNVYS